MKVKVARVSAMSTLGSDIVYLYNCHGWKGALFYPVPNRMVGLPSPTV